MSNLHAEDRFMYQNASTTDAMQASYENNFLDDYEQVSLDYSNINVTDYDTIDLTTPTKKAVILDLLAEEAQEDGLYDNVEKPMHYNVGGIECIEAIKASMTEVEFRGYLKGNTEKYLWRYAYKGGLEDLKKSRWYLDYLIAEMEQVDGYNG